MPSISGSLSGHEDFELGVPRTVPITYDAELPENGAADGLVFLIPGFGDDTDEAFMRLTRRQIAAKYNLVAVSARVHCHFCRPKQSIPGACVSVEIDPWSIAKSIGALVLQGDDLKGLSSADEKATIHFLKSRRKHQFKLDVTLVPPGKDYQNFGVLAALDYLRVLDHLIDDGVKFDHENIVCVGTSHGAYISHLIHKFAPNTIAAVIDSSAYPETVPAYLGFGGSELTVVEKNIEYTCSTKTAWKFDSIGAPDYFGPDQAAIRNIAQPHHLATVQSASRGRTAQMRMIHSVEDKLVDVAIKRRQADLLAQFEYDVNLIEVSRDNIDGDFIKSLDHGMGIALPSLFDRLYPSIQRRPGKTDRDLKTRLCFEGIRSTYRIDHGPAGVVASITTNSSSLAKSDALSA